MNTEKRTKRQEKREASRKAYAEAVIIERAAELTNEAFPVKIDEWEGRDLFVAFPAYKTTNPVTAWCLVAIALDLGREKVRFDMEMGDAMIYHTRNLLVDRFRQSGAQWLLFVDDDMVLPIGRPDFLRSQCRLPRSYPQEAASLHVVHRLLQHNLPFVGATYFNRHEAGRPVNGLHNNADYVQAAMAFTDAVHPCNWVGTGCLLIHRTVFDDIETQNPSRRMRVRGGEDIADFFCPDIEILGEDQQLGRLALNAGIQPHVDSFLQALHVGYKSYGQPTAVSANPNQTWFN